MLRMVVSSGPKRRLNATCSSSVSDCPRKSSTECSLNAATISWNARSSTVLTSTPTISAPTRGWSFLVVNDMACPPSGVPIISERVGRPQPLAPPGPAGMLSAGRRHHVHRRIPDQHRHRSPGARADRARGRRRLDPAAHAGRRGRRADGPGPVVAAHHLRRAQPGDPHRLPARRRQPAALASRVRRVVGGAGGAAAVGADRRRGGGRGQGRHRVGAARRRAPHQERRHRPVAAPGGGDAARLALLPPVRAVRLQPTTARRSGVHDRRGLDGLPGVLRRPPRLLMLWRTTRHQGTGAPKGERP